MNKRLIFPIGGGGNHLRWLMYFDKSFDTMHFSSDKSPTNKLTFIETQVYPKERTWHNWIEFEWKYRKRYNFILNIEVHHDFIEYKENTKTIILSFNDYTECIKKFLVIGDRNMFPNNTLSEIKEVYNRYSNDITSNTYSPLEKIITSDAIWEDVLDKKLYYDIINFLELEDHYEYAAKAHILWKNCQNQALNQFMETCQNDEYINFLRV